MIRNIKLYKTKLRQKYRSVRERMPKDKKSVMDEKILNKIFTFDKQALDLISERADELVAVGEAKNFEQACNILKKKLYEDTQPTFSKDTGRGL